VEIWEKIRAATIKGELGTASQVWQDGSEDITGREALICAFTKDFTDVDEVKRGEMRHERLMSVLIYNQC
jgi:Domain of unknown function (DUF1917)